MRRARPLLVALALAAQVAPSARPPQFVLGPLLVLFPPARRPGAARG